MPEAADLTPAQITESWRLFDCDYASCQQTVNHRCRTASGALAAVHANRRVKMAAYLSRQPEVDALNALITSLRAANDQLTATLQTSDEKAAALAGQVATLTADLAAARARVAELEAKPDPAPTPTPDPTPAPKPKRPIFGACVLTTSPNVLTKFGQRAAVRIFQSAPSVVAVTGSPLLHLSIKQSGSDAATIAWLKSGGVKTWKHEPDNDGMTTAQIAAWKAENNRLYDLNVSLGRPSLIAPTFTGDFWSNHTTDEQRAVWLDGLKADLYGLDFDGVHDSQTSAPADKVYRVGKTEITNADEIAALGRAMAKYGVSGYCVPEFGISRATWDTDGTGRAKWIQANAQRFTDSGAYYVAWYDHAANGKSDVVDPGSPELAALKALVASNP